MKKILAISVLVFAFSSQVFADVKFTVYGDGTTIDAVKAFNKAVILNDGTVDKNHETDYSAVGWFESSFRAKMSAEVDNGKVTVLVKVNRPPTTDTDLDFLVNLTVKSRIEMELATKLSNTLQKNGYRP